MNARVIEPSTIKHEFERIDVHPAGIELMEPKSRLFCVKICGLNVKQANVLKQEALAVGADAAVPYSVLNLEDKNVDVIVIGNLRHYRRLVEKLEKQFFNLKEVGQEIINVISNYENPASRFWVSDREIVIDDFMIMGILNITPDSFYDGGRYFRDTSFAVERAVEMESQGASIIDIGAESSRPGSAEIDEEEEIKRLIPVLKELKKRLRCLISCDTSRSKVARIAIEEGADIINDIYALRRDEEIVRVVAEKKCALVLMHMKGTPETMQVNPFYEDVVGEICQFFQERIKFAIDNGIERNRLIIDPGIGFGKRIVDNLEILKRLREFTCFGLPVLIGISRKSFIGKISGDIPADERLPGTIASCVYAYTAGAKIFRVHDVKEIKQAIEIASAIKKYDEKKNPRT